ncbi:Tim44 domain-containing protein [Verticiella sediminum]|uniref:Tim44 domain-containing protein n=1 Tax=Verticiella sediminum TaxID=1247510 RepID=A0A556ALQ2_9BURK|nr:TIM44-like domain-containing protein [Verticiella sediminum]TSH93824.1 Tim44 domain-containing protein [Verticiella sediminum]
MSRSLTSRLAALAITVFSTVAMLGVSFEAEAQRRMGGGNFGRQSSNVTQMRAPATPPATNAARTPQGQPAPSAAAAGTGAAAGAAARSGASRWFGPIAGIAAGLGLAALLSHLGLGAAFAEFMASLLLIALVAFAVIFLVRRLMGGARRTAMQGAGQATPMQRQTAQPEAPASLSRRAGVMQSTAHTPQAHPAVAATAAPATVPADGNWHIPAGFDTQQFLQNAKQHFIALQSAWDRNDLVEMREYMTDQMVEALRAPLAERTPGGKTEVMLLNAEMLGIENIEQGNLASVRFSGMLKDDSGPEAYRFEEVWNFLKPAQGGWVLAGIQQIPVEYES